MWRELERQGVESGERTEARSTIDECFEDARLDAALAPRRDEANGADDAKKWLSAMAREEEDGHGGTVAGEADPGCGGACGRRRMGAEAPMWGRRAPVTTDGAGWRRAAEERRRRE